MLRALSVSIFLVLLRERRLQNRRFHAEMRLAYHIQQRADQGLATLRQWISEARAAARQR